MTRLSGSCQRSSAKLNEPVREKKPTIWVPTRSDKKQPVQSQKMVLDLESREIVLSV